MSKLEKITFIGSGINAGSLFPQRVNGLDNSRIRYAVQGATWPFAQLSIDKEFVKFDIDLLFIHRTVKASDVTVDLSKLGYVYFRTPSSTDEFGFWTLGTDALLDELCKHDFQLGDSCSYNLRTAKVTMYTMIILEITLSLFMIVIALLKK